MLLEAGELLLGVQREVAVLDPCEIGGFALPDVPGRAALVLAEADGRLACLLVILTVALAVLRALSHSYSHNRH